MAYIENGGSLLNRAIREAIARGERELTVTGDYLIEETVVLPSHFTLTLDGCHLRLADGTFCRIFENQYVADIDRGASATPDADIRLLGKNGATLDGGNYNGLCEYHYRETPYHMSVNNLLLFLRVTGFRVEGLFCTRQRWWALNFVACAFGVVRNIEFLADATRLLPDGSRTAGLSWQDYENTYIKNADGIDIRRGCHDILIEDISGFTEDDTIALTTVPRDSTSARYGVKDVAPGIASVTIRRVRASSFCSIVRLLNQGGDFMRDITIEEVYDTGDHSPYMEAGLHAVRIGDTHAYDDSAPVLPPENITVRHITGAQGTVVDVACEIRGEHFADFRGVREGQNILVRH